MANDELEGDYKWHDKESHPKRLRPIGQDNIFNNQKQTITDIQNLREKKIENMPNNSENLEYKGDSEQLKLKKSEKSKNLEKEEPTITKSDIQEVIKLLQQIASGVVELQGMKPYTYDDRGRETTRRGRAHVYKYLNYYDVTNNIKKAGPIDPQDFDSPVYNAERVFDVLERYADIIHVINGGTESLFVIVSHEGKTNFSKEAVIFPGEVKQLYNVYELRLRSPEVGLPYRVTEYFVMSVSQTSLIPIELASLHDVPLPEEDKDWLPEDIVPLISPTTFRIEVAVSVSGIFKAAITNGGNIQVVDFNVTSGPELIEDGVYVFELLVHKGDSVNFRYSTDNGTIKILRLQEIDASTA